MNKEVVILNEERNVSLTVYLHEESEAISTIKKRPLALVRDAALRELDAQLRQIPNI